MITTVTLDKAGRVVIPKALRDELRLSPGDNLELKCEGDCMLLRPLGSATSMMKEQGVWVYRSDEKLSAQDTEKALRHTREQRDRQNRGGL